MIRLTDTLLDQLTALVANVLGSPLEFDPFTQRIGIPYQPLVSPNATFGDMQQTYIRKLNGSGKLNDFIQLLLQEFGQNDLVGLFKSEYEKLRDPAAPNKYKKALFDPCLLANDKLCFLRRPSISERLYELAHNGPVNNHIFLNGDSGTGLSYIAVLLREIAAQTNAFKVVKIDLNVIFRRINGQIQMEHIASEFVRTMGDLNPDYVSEGDGKFKYEVFYNDLRNLLEQTPERYLFFLDQFNNAYSDEVGNFVQEFTTMLFETFQERHFIILSGFKDIYRFNYEVESSAETVKLAPFQLAEVEAYLRSLHAILQQKYEVGFSAEEMLAMLKTNERFFDPQLYQPDAAPNVTVVGRSIDTWLRNFTQQLPPVQP